MRINRESRPADHRRPVPTAPRTVRFARNKPPCAAARGAQSHRSPVVAERFCPWTGRPRPRGSATMWPRKPFELKTRPGRADRAKPLARLRGVRKRRTRRCRRAGAGFSQPADPRDRRVRPGLGRRHHGPRGRGPHEPDPRPADRGREQDRRRLEPGSRGGRARPQGRLHPVDGDHLAADQRGGGAEPDVRLRQGLRSDRARVHHRESAGGPPVDRGEERQGTDRARQGEAGHRCRSAPRGSRPARICRPSCSRCLPA